MQESHFRTPKFKKYLGEAECFGYALIYAYHLSCGFVQTPLLSNMFRRHCFLLLQRNWSLFEYFGHSSFSISCALCCKLEQPRREGMCLKGGASPYFIRQCKPTYLCYEGSKRHTLPKDGEHSNTEKNV